MVKITYRPFREIVIMDYTQYPKPEYLGLTLTASLQSGQSAALFWADGVVFLPMPLPIETETIAKEYLDGRIIWPSVIFAIMPSYQQVVKVGALEIPVIDVSPNSILRRVAKWLKARSKSSS